MKWFIRCCFLILCLMWMLGCDMPINVDVPPIEVPPPTVENLIIVTPESTDVITHTDSECTFQPLPDYPEGYISSCIVNCCTWTFPESNGACEEKWCLNLSDNCGWYLESWECYRN